MYLSSGLMLITWFSYEIRPARHGSSNKVVHNHLTEPAFKQTAGIALTLTPDREMQRRIVLPSFI